MRTAFIAHGFNSRHHSLWVRDMGSRLEAVNMAVVPVWYGWRHLLRIRRTTSREAARLARVTIPGAVGIGHSNGCALLLAAARLGADLDHLIFINPALPPDAQIPPGVRRVDVFHAENDWAVVAGRWWAAYNPLRLLGWRSPWGQMGRVGYRGPAAHVRNWPLGRVGHSGALRWDRLVILSDQIVRIIERGEEPNGWAMFEGEVLPVEE